MKGIMKSNAQKLYYALQLKNVPVYKRDKEGNIIYNHYTDAQGNIVYYLDEDGNKIPMDTGNKQMVYATPEEFKGNIAMSGGEALPVEYGLSTESYSAVLVTGKNYVPVTDGTLIWHKSPIKYLYGGEEIEVEVDGEIIQTKVPVESSADYVVTKCSPSINTDKYV